jgi:hypothetical protein
MKPTSYMIMYDLNPEEFPWLPTTIKKGTTVSLSPYAVHQRKDLERFRVIEFNSGFHEVPIEALQKV